MVAPRREPADERAGGVAWLVRLRERGVDLRLVGGIIINVFLYYILRECCRGMSFDDNPPLQHYVEHADFLAGQLF
jgi:hypothetical protein